MPVTCIGYCREYAFKRPGSKFSLERKLSFKDTSLSTAHPNPLSGLYGNNL
jgi:hypothetical protein